MCGICGFYTNKDITFNQLKQMNDTMVHRGPDDSGEMIFDAGNRYICGMAHRRLSIMDTSLAGHQPMLSNDKRLIVVFNGEIYNFKELRQKLKEYIFKSNCDTEVILAAYQKWGLECFTKFNGMFAIALYDIKENALILARDRIGKKPLYYWYKKEMEGENLVFASELKPIMKFPGFNKEIRHDIIPKYLLKGYINAPNTVFKNVFKLNPGEMLIYRNNTLLKRKYWEIALKNKKLNRDRITDFHEAKSGLDRIFGEAVKDRLKSDVPLGCLLSGGYDSSLVAAVAQQELGSTPLRTFSIGFDEKDYNEAQFAKTVSQYLGTTHTEMYCRRSDILELVDSIPQYFDEPLADPSEIPTMMVSKLARDHVTTVLSGDGGDELFCGYNHYKMVRMAQRFDMTGAALNKLGDVIGINKFFPYGIKLVANNREKEGKTQLLYRPYAAIITRMLDVPYEIGIFFDNEHKYEIRNWEERRMLLDMETYLPGAVLAKVDRASMKYSLECRSPLLDYRVIEYSFRLDQSLKDHNGSGKYILKELAHEYIPKKLVNRPKKGFSIPVDEWLRSYFYESLREYASVGYLRKQGIFNPEFTHYFVEEYIKNGNLGRGRNFAFICWNFYVFQQWYDYYFNLVR